MISSVTKGIHQPIHISSERLMCHLARPDVCAFRSFWPMQNGHMHTVVCGDVTEHISVANMYTFAYLRASEFAQITTITMRRLSFKTLHIYSMRNIKPKRTEKLPGLVLITFIHKHNNTVYFHHDHTKPAARLRSMCVCVCYCRVLLVK